MKLYKNLQKLIKILFLQTNFNNDNNENPKN